NPRSGPPASGSAGATRPGPDGLAGRAWVGGRGGRRGGAGGGGSGEAGLFGKRGQEHRPVQAADLRGRVHGPYLGPGEQPAQGGGGGADHGGVHAGAALPVRGRLGHGEPAAGQVHLALGPFGRRVAGQLVGQALVVGGLPVLAGGHVGHAGEHVGGHGRRVHTRDL